MNAFHRNLGGDFRVIVYDQWNSGGEGNFVKTRRQIADRCDIGFFVSQLNNVDTAFDHCSGDTFGVRFGDVTKI